MVDLMYEPAPPGGKGCGKRLIMSEGLGGQGVEVEFWAAYQATVSARPASNPTTGS